MCISAYSDSWQWKTWAFLWEQCRLGDLKVLYVRESTFCCCFICLKIDILVLYLSRHCIQSRNELQWSMLPELFGTWCLFWEPKLEVLVVEGSLLYGISDSFAGLEVELISESCLNEQSKGVHSAFRFRLSFLRDSVLNWEEDAWKGFLCYFWAHHCSQHVSVMKASIEMWDHYDHSCFPQYGVKKRSWRIMLTKMTGERQMKCSYLTSNEHFDGLDWKQDISLLWLKSLLTRTAEIEREKCQCWVHVQRCFPSSSLETW